MAAQARSARRLIGRAFGWLAAGFAALVAAYLLAAWVGSSLPRNPAWEEPAEGITIMVETNGLHTGIVMPIASDVIDWREVFPSAAQPTPSGELPTHIAVGWGEREVYLNTPEWSDLKPGTALRVLVAGGDAVMQVGHYVRPAPSEWHRPMRLRPEEYRRLIADIQRFLPPVPAGEARRDHLGFDPNARYFDSLGRYTAINTCNTWVGNRLAAAGVKAGRWTPLAGGVMKWVPRPDAR